MDQIFGSLKNLFKVDFTTIDNNVFRLHYKFTVATLIAFSILVTCRQYIGDPIDCIYDSKSVPAEVMDTFCWNHNTFSVVSGWNKTVGDEVAYPGVENYPRKQKKERVFHAYYQWVCFVLFLQALLFYVPRYFWKAMEGRKVKNLIQELNSPILSEETKKSNRQLLVDYLATNLTNNTSYFFALFLAEIMNFVNVVSQMFLVNTFLGGEFLTYGIKVFEFTGWYDGVRFDPMIKVFPRMTKCTFYYFGTGGSPQPVDSVCILPINIINEKIYVFLWFWFVILAIVSGLAMVYRGITLTASQVRLYITRSRARYANKDYLQAIINKCDLGGWLLLDLICKNIDPMNFRDVINDLVKRLDGKNVGYV